MASIKPIVGSSVHQIQSGQVIVDLCSVVKELVENSLDARATSVDVRFKDHGLESIEVQDNGSGISKDDYESIALKHYTSKLSTYDDLTSLRTFGFRGEALSSLCAVSNLHINTARQDEAPKGTRLDFEVSGKLKGSQVVASQKGTTVIVETVFKNLPVRRQELVRNIKREYSKVLGLLQAYACISINVKFSVSNIMGKGKKTVAFATKPNKTTRENIANVFGAKTLAALVALDLDFEMQRSSTLRLSHTQDGGDQVRVNGHVSKPIFGEGRQTPDRQMFFVNSRPCSLPQVAKVINEVYKSFNVSQSPFVFANVLLDTNAYDVNVSPDKRTILLHDQGNLLEALRSSLTELFDKQQQTVPQSLTRLQSTILSKPAALRSATPPNPSKSTQAEKTLPTGLADGHRSDHDEANPLEDPPALSDIDSGDRPDRRESDLISQFQDRKIQHRESEGRGQQRVASGSRISKDRRRLSSTSIAEEDDNSPIETAPTEIDAGPSDKTIKGVDQPLLDFNKRLSEFQPAVSNSSPPPSSSASPEPEISSIVQSPVKPSPGVVPIAFDRMRPLRTPLREATITVDDKVFTSIIGSQPAQQQNRFTVAAPRSKATPKRAPPVSHTFSQALSSFRAMYAEGSGPPKLANEIRDEDPEEMEDEASEEEAGVSVGLNGDGDNEHGSQDQRPIWVESVSRRQRSTTREIQEIAPDAEPRTDRRRRGVETGLSAAIDEDLYDATGSEGASANHNVPEDSEDSDEEYLDESTNKAREDAKVARMIQEAEEKAARPTEDDGKRAQNILKGINRRYSTFNLSQMLNVSVIDIDQQIRIIERSLVDDQLPRISKEDSLSQIEPNTTAEDRLSLTVSKADFEHMRIIGQFNLGFIIAFRSATHSPADEDSTRNLHPATSDIFIIDQHASDEKSNFESLQLSTTVQAQPLVNAFPLSLTAIEEEIIIENQESFAKNGFVIDIDESGDSPVGQRCKLRALPMSKELTFDLRDLEELIALLAESSNSAHYSPTALPSDDEAPPTPSRTRRAPGKTTVRPTKVRKMFAMRACRSSIMVGKSLSHKDMRKVVRRMGEMDKPWNCPHGRPTMRHLVGVDKWESWAEGDGLASDGVDGEDTDTREVEEDIDWGAWMRR